jgi:hypothetical protein
MPTDEIFRMTKNTSKTTLIIASKPCKRYFNDFKNVFLAQTRVFP